MRSPNFPIALLFLAASVCVFAAVPCSARQASSAAALRVTVADANQRPVPGALCSLLRDAGDKQAVASASTDEQGVATFQSVAPGSYTLRVEREGFDPYDKSGVVIRQDSTAEAEVALAVARVSESVTVEAAS